MMGLAATLIGLVLGMCFGFTLYTIFNRYGNKVGVTALLFSFVFVACAHRATAYTLTQQDACAYYNMSKEDCSPKNCYKTYVDEGEIRACKLGIIFKCINPCYQGAAL